jgi:predicted dehydrogenase
MIEKTILFIPLFGLFYLQGCNQNSYKTNDKSFDMNFTGAPGEVKIITLDPGHFHSSLVQKYRYNQVDSVVHIYAQDGPELKGHLELIQSYNQRTDNPTNWETRIHTSPDFLQRMVREKQGNVVVISGNNAQKMNYIRSSIEAGLNVLADKPMAINPADFSNLQATFRLADEKCVLLYDIMTERYEITTMMQKALSQIPEVFGELENGTVNDPAITKESVHHFFKHVSGKPLIRPAWFFDVAQQGEGIVDVATHLVDLVFWECFPEQEINYEQDIEILAAKHWPTKMSPDQFNRVTGLSEFPDYLQKDLINDSLHVYSNGAITFAVKGVYSRISVIWNYQAPEGAGDAHYSIMRGTQTNLVIRQGAEQNYKPVLYVEPVDEHKQTALATALPLAIKKITVQYPGLSYRESENGWEILIPEVYDVGHESHFAQVTEKYLQYLVDGELPEWEVPNMLAKYFVTTSAYRLSRKNKQ